MDREPITDKQLEAYYREPDQNEEAPLVPILFDAKYYLDRGEKESTANFLKEREHVPVVARERSDLFQTTVYEDGSYEVRTIPHGYIQESGSAGSYTMQIHHSGVSPGEMNKFDSRWHALAREIQRDFERRHGTKT
jgi:hypothetical protein